MKNQNDILGDVLRKHEREVREVLVQKPDWEGAARKFDALFGYMADPKDHLWSSATIETLTPVYLAERGNYESGNITLRTVARMPARLHNDTKKIFLQIAEFCTLFNASHKVYFEADELPEGRVDVALAPA